MTFELSEEILAVRDAARKFARNEVLPRIAEDERNHVFPEDVVRKMGAMGLFGCPIPETYGGSDLGFLAHAVVTEEISKVSGSLRAAFNMQTMGTAREILQFGTEDQKEAYVSRLVNAEILGCIGITEPNAGSDVGSLKTRAEKKGDRYLLSGSKTWITYAQVADLGLIYAYTDPTRRYKGMSAFLVDLHQDGVSRGPAVQKLGWNACPTGELFFDQVEVPAENLLGCEEGRGFEFCMAGLNNTRLTAAAGAVGVSQGLIDEAIKYAKEREQFGKPIGRFQMVQEELARMVVETEAARLMTYRCAMQKDEGLLHNALETSMAKYYASDVASRVADGALRILGAYGYSSEYPVERLLREAKLPQILEGSANILKMVIAMDALGYRKANR
ncbi:MAG: acyl-CoA dehydrogenase family protein [Deltaproteobacteria bacterium]|nr:acyl-CoA dehydrogenase family protein [Deltaproteobacteria bacterium]MBW1925391.1 acyl-CoA dehydrogenase family protein [Deltaproteobacteria bacterium]MBW1950970.1 acyl-CoA dehydrogenase family protein [Deltaproteobacteria bacterium]MBW2009194.1 acyl-CoA dehydrogenase family protein [Deltaproteobacteria bacterium]MBW2103884.1 acyl-CoA dehydrogenase family protein [Deltaproteobacteria bacterium]